MTTKLKLYNRALSHLSTVRLSSLTEDRKERYELDAVYDEVLQEMLELGLWKFAIRSSQFDYDPDIDPTFGLSYSYAIPDDFVRLVNISSDDMFSSEVDQYVEENGIWYSNLQTMYIRYISNDADYGLNLGLYPENFCSAFGAHMALRASIPITRDRFTRNDLVNLSTMLLSRAKRLDALDERVRGKPTGRIVASRFAGGGRPGFANGKMSL